MKKKLIQEQGEKTYAVIFDKGDAVTAGLLEARVWPTLEVIIAEPPGHLQRTTDEETGLALIAIAR